MEPSLAARLPLGRRAQRRARGALHLPGALAPRLAALARGRLALLLRRRRARIALVCAALALPALGGGWLWLRSSSLVAVQSVQLSGVRGPQHAAIEAALRGAAHRMTTLDVNAAALRAAVKRYPVVRAVEAFPHFPHGLRIEVLEQLPVAVLDVNGTRSAVAADGVVLGPALIAPGLPAISGSFHTRPGQRVRAAQARSALAVMGAAPATLARHVASIYIGEQGLTVSMHNGLLVFFGDANHARAKWLALAAVLADPSSAGAYYVDVRLPGRPAAGFPGGVAPANEAAATNSAEGTGGEAIGGSEATIEALAAGLRTDDPEAVQASSGVAATSTSAGAGAPSETSGTTAPSEAAAATTPTEAAATGAPTEASGAGSAAAQEPATSEPPAQ